MDFLARRQSGNDPNIGSARDTPSPSLSGMISTLVPVLIISAVYLVIFLILRKSQRRFYAPRTYLGSLRESERTPPLPSGLFNWLGSFWKLPDVYALRHQSLDAYLFIRFLRICVNISFVGLCITWPILFPINATGGGGASQLDVLSYSNVDVKGSGKYKLFAHALVGWIFWGFVMYTVFRESIFYINLRQAFLLSPLYSKRISSRTVLFTSVPSPYLDEARLRKVFEGSVKNIWITSDTKEVEKLVEERDKAAMRLEKAECKLIKAANAERLKAIKKGGADAAEAPAPFDAESGSVAARWVPRKKRPTHRTGLLGLVGKKVDTIDWCRTELQRLIPLVDAAQAKYRSGADKKVGAVFVEFHLQSEAEAAYQVLTHHQPLHMTPKHIGITPGDVVWSSLKLPWWQLIVRRFAVLAFITAMIIFWAIPVGVVGAISNITYLETHFSWLQWLTKVPSVIMGVITGLLPAVALSILMSLVPIVMRLCAKIAGEPSNSRVELFTQNAYFCFQLIQVFLVATLTSSASSAFFAIKDNPGSVFSMLSTSLPKSSNFYISYFIVQGLTQATSVLTQVVGFFIFRLLYKFLATTPRSMYQKWTNLSAISWGSVLPVYTNIAVISITYVVIAPLMLFWSTIGLGLFYLAYRYNILFVTDTKIDTRGLIYPRALQQLMSGVYLAEICMIGLFSVSVAIGPLVLTIAFLIFTVLFHISLNQALTPLLYNLPRTLQMEEQSLYTDLEGAVGVDPGVENSNGSKMGKGKFDYSNAQVGKKGNFITKFLKPWDYTDYPSLRELVPRDRVEFDEMYTPEIEQNAYFPPCASSPTPLLWIPEDLAGVSKQEIAHTSKIIPITDEGCKLNDQNKLEWDSEGARPPIWDEKVYY